MSATVRGLLLAGGTTVAVLLVGLAFLGVGESPPAAKPAPAASADESTLSLEARRQARLAQSQAMLGGGKPVPDQPDQPAPAPAPAPSPSDPPPATPPPPPAEATAPPAPAAITTDGPVASAAAAAPVVVPMPPPPPPHERPCTVATSGNTPVAEACRHGGRPEAKQLMKRLVAQARNRGARYTCDSCHLDQNSYHLREDARSELTTLLDNNK